MPDISIIRVDKSDSNTLRDFLEFPLSLYGDSPWTWYNIAKTRSMVTSSGEYELFVVRKSSGEIVGRMAIGVNRSLIDEGGKAYAWIGLFDVIEEYTIFCRMIDFGKKHVSGHSYILFPLFKATWYPYRFVTQGFDNYHYFMEYPEKPYYAEFTQKYGFDTDYTYVGSISRDIENLIQKNKKSYDKAIANGITYRDFKPSQARDELKIIYDMTNRNYPANLFFSPISFEEFFSLYEGVVRLLDKKFFTFALNEQGKEVGYGFSPPDYTPLLEKYDTRRLIDRLLLYKNRKKVTGFVLKTAATDAEYRQFGIYGGISYLHAREAKKRGFDYVIGGFTYIENVTHKVMPEGLTWKEHRLFRISV